MKKSCCDLLILPVHILHTHQDVTLKKKNPVLLTTNPADTSYVYAEHKNSAVQKNELRI